MHINFEDFFIFVKLLFLTFFLIKRNYKFENVRPKKKVLKITGIMLREQKVTIKFT